MPTAQIGSILVGSSQAEKMKDWYCSAFGVEANDMGALDFGNVQLFIEPHSQVGGPTKEPARIIVNLDAPDCRALEGHLRKLGVTWEREVEQMPFGLIGTVADPDGNFVQIIQWGANPESHQES